MIWQMLSLIKSPILLILFVLLLVFPLLFSISFHEFAHGYVAYKFGDPTAKMMGRLTMNPLKHLDPLGTILLFVIGLGWAKPVVVDFRNIPNPTKQMLVALAGPVSNFFLALIFGVLIWFFIRFLGLSGNNFIIMLLDSIVMINIALALFNLIPVPPLDGSRIVSWILYSLTQFLLQYQVRNNSQMAQKILDMKIGEIYYKFERYGIAILMVIMVFFGFSWLFRGAYILKSCLYMLLGV